MKQHVRYVIYKYLHEQVMVNFTPQHMMQDARTKTWPMADIRSDQSKKYLNEIGNLFFSV